MEAIVLENPEYADLATFLRLTRASLGLYADPLKMVVDSKSADKSAKGKLRARIKAKLFFRTKEVNAGEDINLEVELANEGKAPALLTKVEKIIPADFELVDKPDYCGFQEAYLNMNGKRVDPLMTEKIRLTLRSFERGRFTIRPRIINEIRKTTRKLLFICTITIMTELHYLGVDLGTAK